MSHLRDFAPGQGSERISHEDISAAAKRGDVELLRLYASNLLWWLEQAYPILESARAAAVQLDEVTRDIDRP